jgi:hypothetical protein
MSTKEDLIAKIARLEAQTEQAQASLDAILIAEYELQPGDVVRHYGKDLTVSSVAIRHGKARAFGRKAIKGGLLGSIHHEIYGTYTKLSAIPVSEPTS